VDTDIGHYIDDTFAISLLLKTNLDIRLILTSDNNTLGRAQIVAKFLQEVDRTNIDIGVGFKNGSYVGPLYDWARHYSLHSYPGNVYSDGITRMIEIINEENEVVIISLAPLTNIKWLIKLRPDLVSKVVVISMSGAIRVCYEDQPPVCPEYNIVRDIIGSKLVYSTIWRQNLTITTLDTGNSANINGTLYQKILAKKNDDIIVNKTIENYQFWRDNGGCKEEISSNCDPAKVTPPLYDAVAAWLAFSNRNAANMVPMKLVVESDGSTVNSMNGQWVDVALSWTSLKKWQQEVTDVLTQ